MRRHMAYRIAALVAALVLAAVLAVPAGAGPPGEDGVGGTFSNPCGSGLFSFFATGHGGSHSITAQNFVAQGTGVDHATGREYQVLWQSTQTAAPDESGLTLHIQLRAQAGPDTFVFGGVAVLNFRPDAPVELNFLIVTCAGRGSTEV